MTDLDYPLFGIWAGTVTSSSDRVARRHRVRVPEVIEGGLEGWAVVASSDRLNASILNAGTPVLVAFEGGRWNRPVIVGILTQDDLWEHDEENG